MALDRRTQALKCATLQLGETPQTSVDCEDPAGVIDIYKHPDVDTCHCLYDFLTDTRFNKYNSAEDACTQLGAQLPEAVSLADLQVQLNLYITTTNGHVTVWSL